MAQKDMQKKQIIAMGGGGFSMEPENPLLDDYILSLSPKKPARVCFVPTASGDAETYIQKFYQSFPSSRCQASHLGLFRRTVSDLRAFIFAQDIIYVGGGNTMNLLAIWQKHGLDIILREAWERGIILCGLSAGGLCWFDCGITDSFGPELAPLYEGLGLLAGSFCPHFDGEENRRPIFHRQIKQGLSNGFAADDGAALHFIGTDLSTVVSSRENAFAYTIKNIKGTVEEKKLVTKFLGE